MGHCLWGNGLAINSSWVRVLGGHHCIVALVKLLTPVCLLSPSSIIWYQPRGVNSDLYGEVTTGLVESTAAYH